MKILSLEQIAREAPEKAGEAYDKINQWKPITVTLPGGREVVVGFDNPGFGRIERKIICDDSGKMIYGLPEILEGPVLKEEDLRLVKGPVVETSAGKRALVSGAVLVPYFLKDGQFYVGVVKQPRPVMGDPRTGAQGQFPTVEIPRGFSKRGETLAETATREMQEETGRKLIKDAQFLQTVNINTAFYKGWIGVYAAEVDPAVIPEIERKDKKKRTEEEEKILACKFVPYDDLNEFVRQSGINCLMSLGALKLFDTHVYRHAVPERAEPRHRRVEEPEEESSEYARARRDYEGRSPLSRLAEREFWRLPRTSGWGKAILASVLSLAAGLGIGYFAFKEEKPVAGPRIVYRVENKSKFLEVEGLLRHVYELDSQQFTVSARNDLLARLDAQDGAADGGISEKSIDAYRSHLALVYGEKLAKANPHNSQLLASLRASAPVVVE